MLVSLSRRNILIKEVCFLFAVILTSFLFVLARFKFTIEYHESTLMGLIDYQAKTPFQYRILVPFLAKQLVFFLKWGYVFSFKLIEFIATSLLIFCFRYFLQFFIPYKHATIYCFTLFIPLSGFVA